MSAAFSGRRAAAVESLPPEGNAEAGCCQAERLFPMPTHSMEEIEVCASC